MDHLPGGQKVAQLQTTLGELCIQLLDSPDEAPGHVENFLWYLDNGLLTNTFFHRRSKDFVVQGADFRFDGDVIERTPAREGVVVENEPCFRHEPLNGTLVCTERGNIAYTVALAKLGGDPDSGSTSWFINLADNRFNLDNQNEGFTVFGQIIDEDSRDVVDAIAADPDPFPTYEDLFWVGLESRQLLGLESTTPFFGDMPAFPGPGTGCLDMEDQATVLQPDLNNLLFEPYTPADESPFYETQSAACGTPLAGSVLDWTPQPGPPSCPDLDRIAIRTIQPSINTGDFPTVPAPFTYVTYTCEQRAQATAERDAWRVAMQSTFLNGLVFIEDAEVLVSAPEPSTATMLASTVGAFAWLRSASRRRRIARRS